MLSFTVGKRDVDLPTVTKLESKCPVQVIDILWLLHNPNELSVIEFYNSKGSATMCVKGMYNVDQLIEWYTNNIYSINKITITHRNGSDGGVELILDSNGVWFIGIIGAELVRKKVKRIDTVVTKFAKQTYLSFKYASGLNINGTRVFHLPFNIA